MLQILKSYVTSDGTPFTELKQAQAHELARIMEEATWDSSSPQAQRVRLAEAIVNKAAEAVDILTTTPTSLLKARRSRGGTKPRKPKPEVKNLI